MPINTYFTHSSDVRSLILDKLEGAQRRVMVAVAWFTDVPLFEKLIEIAGRGVKVEIIVTNHEFNDDGPNDYSRIEHYGGFFAKVGSDEQLMHMKFCIIDSNVVISGSANWSKRAFEKSHEEVTIAEADLQRAQQFVAEFDRLKRLSGFEPSQEELDLVKAFKYFKLIRAFIDLDEVVSMLPYAQELREMEGLEPIAGKLLNAKYPQALALMKEFEQENTRLVRVQDLERDSLQIQIGLLSLQVEGLIVEKEDIESVLYEFNHRQIIELSPLMTRVLKLKAKIFDKLRKHGIENEEFKEAQKEYEDARRKHEEAMEADIPDLTDEEALDIKEAYREAVKLCHPDSPECIWEDKEQASEVFSRLAEAYRVKNVEEVNRLLRDLKLGKKTEGYLPDAKLEMLRARLAQLQDAYNRLIREIDELLHSEDYKALLGIEDWDDYFDTQKLALEQQVEELEDKYYQNGEE